MTDHAEPDAAGFLRDTLAFRVGVLARAALRAAFSDATMQAVYAAWLSAPVPEPAPPGQGDAPEYQTLMEAGMEHGGSLVLQARKRPEEFVVSCEHEQFTIAACVAFAPRPTHMNGLHVVSCTGKPRAALAWLEQTAMQLQRLLGATDRPAPGARPRRVAPAAQLTIPQSSSPASSLKA